jgi:putative MATE family efflux protein
MFDLSTDDITDGPVHRALLVLAAPLLIQNAVRIAEQIVDLFWVGHYSGDAVAAIGLGGPVLWFLQTTVITTSFVGTQVLVSQRVGAEDPDGARRAAFVGLTLAAALALVIGGIMYLGVGPLLDLVAGVRPGDVGSDVPRLARLYVEVLALGIVFAAAGDVTEAAFLGWGDSRASLYINVSTVAFNLVLDPVFIFGLGPVPELGVLGAGLATVCGWLAGSLFGFFLVARGRAGWIVTRRTARVDVAEYRELLDIGLPAGVKGATGTSVDMAMTVIVFATAGGPGLAAYTIGSRVAGVAFRLTSAFKQATQSVVGQNLGANRPDRAESATWTGVAIVAGGLTAFAAALWIGPGPIVNLLVPNIGETGFELSTTYLRIIAYGLPATGALALLKGGLNGARRTKTTMVASLAEQWGLEIPIAVIGGLVLGGGILPVFWARTIAVFVGALVLGAYYVRATRNGLLDRAAEVATGDSAGTSGD